MEVHRLIFALQLWNGNSHPSKCRPVFEGDYMHMQDALLEICSALGYGDGACPAK